MPNAAAADDGEYGEETFDDEDEEDLSVSSSEPLAPRGQVCTVASIPDTPSKGFARMSEKDV